MLTLNYYWVVYREELKFFSIPELTGAMQSFLVKKGLYPDTLACWNATCKSGFGNRLEVEFARAYNRDQDMELLLSL